MKYAFIALFTALIIVGCSATDSDQSTPTLDEILEGGEWVDLTHVFSEETLYWPTASNFRKDTVFVGITENGFYYEAFNLFGAEHGGTHLDAPIHFSDGQQRVDQIPLDRLMGKAAIIDVSEKTLADRNYQITVSDITAWEELNNQTIDDHIVAFNTGFAQYWPDPLQYMGTDKKGFVGVLALSFPGIDPATATWIVENRSVKAVGLDTPSLDFGKSTLFETHRILFEQNIPGFENMANLNALPATGAFIIALPMKVESGSGAPMRVVAWVNSN